jgi:hypothetical protein
MSEQRRPWAAGPCPFCGSKVLFEIDAITGVERLIRWECDTDKIGDNEPNQYPQCEDRERLKLRADLDWLRDNQGLIITTSESGVRSLEFAHPPAIAPFGESIWSRIAGRADEEQRDGGASE